MIVMPSSLPAWVPVGSLPNTPSSGMVKLVTSSKGIRVFLALFNEL
jgi:hypothetical protein